MNESGQPRRLARWSLHCYALPYQREIRWANAIESQGLYALLVIEDRDGHRGIAEGTLKDTWSGVSARSLAASLEDIVMPRLAGLDPGDAEAVAAAFDPLAENRMARALAQTACWTLEAARQGQALWRLWEGSSEVDLTWTVTRQAPLAMAREAGEVCARYGFRHLKVKGGQGLATDLQALAEIRAAVGEGVACSVDANSACSPLESLAYVQALAQVGVTVVEDPCPLTPDADFERLQAASPLPILVDRACASTLDARLFLERGAQALSAKPGRVGLQQARGVSRLASAAGARSAVGIYAESSLGTLISLQQAAAIPPAQTMAAEQTFFLGMADQVCTESLVIRDGRIRLPETAALDTLVDWGRVQARAICPPLHHPV
jgi:L-alanine-DL-glutamate epimerase-like enolase superfamily enzyme